MTTHVFVVDINTFKYHLEYMFAGTGAKDKLSTFLLDSNISFNATTERMLVGMIADISRIRIGDNIIFYLQASKDTPGMFFGVFKAESLPFFDENNSQNYLVNKLYKGLSFRILISGENVYPKGITEHEYLDSLRGKKHPADLCWSLIYRKLKANRGCTMIMDYEFNDLLEKLKEKNNNISINSNRFTFNTKAKEIEAYNDELFYSGRQLEINVKDRLIYKFGRGNAFETHLQAYLTQNFDNTCYRDILLPLSNEEVWIGNEVSCGVGMQRIDLMFKQETDTDVFIKLIELKDEEPYRDIVDSQIPWYLEWLSYYVIPKYLNKKIHVIPCIIAKGEPSNALKSHFSKFSFDIENVDVASLEYVGFSIDGNDIELIKYL